MTRNSTRDGDGDDDDDDGRPRTPKDLEDGEEEVPSRRVVRRKQQEREKRAFLHLGLISLGRFRSRA